MLLDFESSIEIALSSGEPEPASAGDIVVPVTANESLVAARGLSQHLDILYSGVLKNSDPDQALMQVYNFLSDDIDKFRSRAQNLAAAMDKERAQNESRATAAAAIAYLLIGQHAHRKGVWLRGKGMQEMLIERFGDILRTDAFTFDELLEWGLRQTVRNERFWRHQLQQARANRHVAELREAIAVSDHYAAEV